MKNLFYTGVLALLPLGGFAQNVPCIPPEEIALQQQRLQKNLAAPTGASLRTVQYVPLRFHRVANGAGEGRMAYRHLLDLLIEINADFAPGEIQFYLHDDGTGLFDNDLANDQVFTQAANGGANFQMEAQRDTAAINLYVVDEISNPSPGGVLLGYFSPDKNWIVVTQTGVNGEAWVTSHELGHYLSLLHTFHSWEVPFDAAFSNVYPTWPVAPDSINGYPVELMDGSNCLEAGDLICDTPPDYLFSFTGNAVCAPYTGAALDPNGQPVVPMVNNLMGAFYGCDDYVFTPGQLDVMNTELTSPEQAHLDYDFVPSATEIIVPPDLLVSPPFNFQFPTNVNIVLEWLPVAGATHYLVEVDLIPTFTTPVRLELITTATEITLTEPLLPNKKHYWRVRPFNAYAISPSPLQGPSDESSVVGSPDADGADSDATLGVFFTGPEFTTTHNLAGGARVSLAPNPVAAGDFVQMTLETPAPATAQLRAFDAAGRLLLTETRSLPAGPAVWPVAAEKLAPGVNLLQLNLDGQLVTLRVVRD